MTNPAGQPAIQKGKRFGRLVVLSEAGRKSGKRAVLCKCDCGTRRNFLCGNLRNGFSTSCGCYRKELLLKRHTTHGMAKRKSRGPEYNAWAAMRSRCTIKKSKDWRLYGGRGITYAPQWSDFSTFFRDVGKRPSPRHSLDRWPNTNGNYEPGNVRWATAKQQGRNKRNNVFIVYKGKSRTISEWSEILGMNYLTLYTRLHSGISLRQAFETPVGKLCIPSRRK